MPLPEKQFSELVNDQVAAMQAASTSLLDFSVGSILLSLIQSNSGNTLWIEGLITRLLAVTRLLTSHGNDVDTFIGQFGLTRIAASPATGFVTFSRFTTTSNANIPAGTLDLSSLGALVYSTVSQISYSVYADVTDPNYSPSLNAYVLLAGSPSITVPIVATTAGANGNVLANQITTISSIIIGVDTVTNGQPLTNGEDQESDDAAKIRFVLYLNSLSKATLQAIEATVAGVSGVARYKVVENKDIDGNDLLGFFYVVVDDGTGNASGTLLSNVQAAVYPIRGLTIAFSVYAPTAVPVDITANIVTDGTVSDEDVQNAAIAAYEQFIISQSFNALFPYSEVPRIAYDTNSSLSGGNNYSPIKNVNNYTLQWMTSDLQLVGKEIMIVGTITITINA